MKNLLILGAGTGGTVLANRMRSRLPEGWRLTVVDPSPVHLYQPGLLYLPFGARDEAACLRPRERTLPSGERWAKDGVALVDTQSRRVVLQSGAVFPYDLLVLATGSRLRPELTPGLQEGLDAGAAHQFYTLEGAQALRDAMARFEGGRLVVNVVEMPIKCPVAPLEFLFLADAYFTKRGIRDRVELVFATPLDGAFTRKLCNTLLSHLLVEKGIRIETDFATGELDPGKRVLRSYDERELPFELLVSIPTHSGAAVIERSGLGNELDFVPTERDTLAVKGHDGVFAMGDATDLPSSKAGSVAHFQAHVLEKNLLRAMRGEALSADFDGHANCFVETGFGKALLIDFNYDVDPMPGRYPLAGLGPFTLMEPTRINHLGKRMFRWAYWHALLPARTLPVPVQLSMRGKRPPPAALEHAGGSHVQH